MKTLLSITGAVALLAGAAHAATGYFLSTDPGVKVRWVTSAGDTSATTRVTITYEQGAAPIQTVCIQDTKDVFPEWKVPAHLYMHHVQPDGSEVVTETSKVAGDVFGDPAFPTQWYYEGAALNEGDYTSFLLWKEDAHVGETIGFGVIGNTFTAKTASVPEPSTFMLAGLGALALLFCRKR